jgi:hypothetical protein
MSHTQECLKVLDLLEDGKIDVADAEMLIFAMQPQGHARLRRRETQRPNTISVMVDSTQANLGDVLHRVGQAFEPTSHGEVK